MGIDCTRLQKNNPDFYFTITDQTKHLEHIKYQASITVPKNFSKFIHTPDIKLDIILDSKYELGKTMIPYNEPDFECHRVIQTKYGYTISGLYHPMRKLEKLNRCMEDILQFRAIPCNPQSYRMIRMMSKGFTIQAKSYTGYKGTIGTPIEGHCLQCLENFKEVDFTIKNNCCEARYHVRCFKESQNGPQISKYNNVEYCALCRGRL